MVMEPRRIRQGFSASDHRKCGICVRFYNVRMRRDPLHFAVLSVLLVLGGRALVAEQQRADNIQSDTLSHSHCRSGSDEADKPSGPEFSLADIKFLGSLRLPVVEQ